MNRLLTVVLAVGATTAACSGARNNPLPPAVDAAFAGPDGAPGVTADASADMDGGGGGPLASLVINEIAAKGDPADWLEVYNTGTTWVDLTGFGYSDRLSDPPKAKFPDGVMIAPSGFYAQSLAGDSFGFGSAEQAGIFEPDGRLIDSVSWKKGDSPAGGSYGRYPDGTGPFMTLTQPTPGAPNVGPASAGGDAGAADGGAAGGDGGAP